MRISTGIILSILSANVFAIEHLNVAHSGSLLARRAVVADTDGPSLQKRTNDKEPEEQVKPKKHSFPNSGQEGYATTKDLYKDDSDSNSNSIDGAEGGPTDFSVYDPNQDDEGKDGMKDVYTGIDSDQGRSRLSNALGDSPSQVLGHIKNRLYRAKEGFRFFASKQRAADAASEVWYKFGGAEGIEMGDKVYTLLKYALKVSRFYKILYKDSARSPFRLQLPSTIPNGSKKIYKRLQKEVLKSIEKHITAINDAIESIDELPMQMVIWLKKMMNTVDDFYKAVLETKSEYFSLLKLLGIFDYRRLESLEVHAKDVETYKLEFSDRFSKIMKMVENRTENPKKWGRAITFFFKLGIIIVPRIENQPSGDEASGGAQLNDVETDDPEFSTDEKVGDLMTFDNDEEVVDLGSSNDEEVADLGSLNDEEVADLGSSNDEEVADLITFDNDE
ncbi:hypothetical protein BASA50_005758 [Batrachochytrium salamandrivorans]|uniref:Uncharacterized protein n=1 Tax=Batrachochytrium salamandrivorans TaxID=1357716 RepID=A0ABQ8FCF2_9FUNG|nr:hypothetical protein BASA50_005758 [Batrachochytrium salamandrivorans]